MWGWTEAATDTSMSRIAWAMAWPMRSSLRTCSMRSEALLSSCLDSNWLKMPQASGEADYYDVARVGDFVAKQHSHDAQLHFALGLSVDSRVAPGPEDPEEAVVFALQNPPVYKLGKGLLTDRVSALGGAFNPESGVSLLTGGYIGQCRVKEIVSDRRGIDQNE